MTDGGDRPHEPRRRSYIKWITDSHSTWGEAQEAKIERRRLAFTVGGGLFGLAIGGIVGDGLGALIGLVVGSTAGRLLFSLFVDTAGFVAGSVYGAQDGHTPPPRDYSRAQSLAAAGHYTGAIAAFGSMCTEDPSDPEPYLSVARIYRDHLTDYDRAVHWFKRARSEATLSQSLELLIGQEIVEIYERKTGEPRRAMPELARMVERFPDAAAADWARERLDQLRSELKREMDA